MSVLIVLWSSWVQCCTGETSFRRGGCNKASLDAWVAGGTMVILPPPTDAPFPIEDLYDWRWGSLFWRLHPLGVTSLANDQIPVVSSGL